MTSTVNVTAPKDLGVLVKQVFNESERGFVIAACAYLEKTIDGLWGPKVLKLTIAQKIDLLSAMFLEKKYTDVIKAINKIRNKAAHDYAAFSLKDYSVQLRSDILTPSSRFGIYKKVGNLEIDFSKANVSGLNIQNVKTLLDLKKLLSSTQYKDRFEFLLTTLSLVLYIDAVKSHPVNNLKKFKFDFL